MDFDTEVIIAIYCLVGGVFLMIFTAVICRRYTRNSWDSLPKAKQGLPITIVGQYHPPNTHILYPEPVDKSKIKVGELLQSHY